jgi:hypothetical protein
VDLPRDLQATGFSHVGDDARSGSRSYTTVATPCQLRMQLVLLHLCGSALESLGLGTSSRRLVLSMRGGYGPEADDGHQCQCQHLHRVLAHRGRGQVALEAELIQCGAPPLRWLRSRRRRRRRSWDYTPSARMTSASGTRRYVPCRSIVHVARVAVPADSPTLRTVHWVAHLRVRTAVDHHNRARGCHLCKASIRCKGAARR